MPSRPEHSPIGALCFRCGAVLRGVEGQEPQASGRRVCARCNAAAAAVAPEESRASAQPAPHAPSAQPSGPAAFAGSAPAAPAAHDRDAPYVLDLNGGGPVSPTGLAAGTSGASSSNSGVDRVKHASRRDVAPLKAREVQATRIATTADGDAPFEVLEPTDTPVAHAPVALKGVPLPIPAPEMPSVADAAPSNQVPTALPGRGSLAAASPLLKCERCDYCMEGLRTRTCPECGHINPRRTRSSWMQEQSRQVTREAYRTPTLILAAGLLVTSLVMFFGLPWQSGVAWMIGFPMRVTIGAAAFAFASAMIAGWDAPFGLTMLRIGAMFAVGDVFLGVSLAAGLHSAACMAYLVIACIHVFMMVWLFDLDPADAWLIMVIMTVTNVALGIAFAAMM